MKKAILFMVLFGTQAPVFAGSAKTNTRKQQDCSSSIGNKVAYACLYAWLIPVFLMTQPSSSKSDGALCNPAPINRWDAECLSSQPSHDWVVIGAQLKAMQERTDESCVPGCTIDAWKSPNFIFKQMYVPDGNGSQRRLYNDILSHVDVGAVAWGHGTKFQYAVCKKNSSFVAKIKAGFEEVLRMPLWSVPTKDEDTEGLFFLKTFNHFVFDSGYAYEHKSVIDDDAYKEVVCDAQVWDAINEQMQSDGVTCIGQAFE